ncbi:glycosyltransferase family 2 protein [Vibrio cholerae]|uniref:glycosyltransferase family 2 protein n=1 Tax=Vibrio cholerae TaxID=666 RepID=UPI000F3CC093|nr:glycosyltransferase family 2 protein [Vibrio cholerae]NOE85003.1 glycosyltransferase family 2 protein [Vibrio cholerae]NOE94561.1 glycosyltransferase family 2 protein [Vibrio cholerae]NOE99472.1 glycosyltransferase family 2 protein [Vibrio cholerae]NOF14219.1 glycosyltransferase family 2 protein [Vibrio cholerae]NOF17350.1 glycosyltransferase family 2 protein [Vibrio cholerae]
MTKYSVVIPVYKNEMNILPLLKALNGIQNKLKSDCEFVFVVDGSPDESEKYLKDNCLEYLDNVVVVSLSKNYGSFTAIRAGMMETQSKYIAVMAADLQEPPELILEFFQTLDSGVADICFGERLSRSDPFAKKLLSNIFWSVYRKFIIPDIPVGGVDIFACNLKVKNSILEIEERNSSLIAQLFWVGYRRVYIPYNRREREVGESAWSFKKRIRYMLDSIFSYTDLPIVSLLFLGVTGLFLSFLYVFIVGVAYSFGLISQPGFASQSILITIFGSSSLLGQGILGCYLWRILENSKKRPLYFIERKSKYIRD